MKLFLGGVLILCCVLQVRSQESLPLKEVLTTLESRYDYRFSYADEIISEYTTAIPESTFSFEQAIHILGEETGLMFRILQNRIVTISSNQITNGDICGKLLNMNLEPLEGAVIRSPRQIVISDKEGSFILRQPASSDTLFITYVGHKTLKIPSTALSGSDCTSFIMESEVELLTEITLHNFLTRGIAIRGDGSLKIDAEKFGILPGLTQADPLQAIQTLPGINSNDETVTNINIRGGSHDQNYISWNGMRMYQSGHFFSYISAFNPELVQETTLIKNGTSTEYSGGVSGSILMKTQEELDTVFSGSAGMNLVNALATLSVPLGKKASLKLAARRSLNELFRSQAYQNYFNQAFQNTEVLTNSENVIQASDSFKFYDAAGVLNYHLSGQDKIKAGILIMNNQFSFLENAFVNNVEQSRLSSSDQKNYGGFIQYQKWWQDHSSLELHAYWVDYSLEGRNADILLEQLLKQKNEVGENGIKLATNFRIGSGVWLKTGYDYHHTRVRNLDSLIVVNSETETMNRHALFSEVRWSPWKGGKLMAGARLNYFSKGDQIVAEPRINLVQSIGHHSSLNLAAEIKSQVITQEVDLQTDFLGVENRRWFLANGSERPVLQNRQVSFGYIYKNRQWSVLTEAYLKRVVGINAKSQEFTNSFQRVYALGDYSSEGIDLTINHQSRSYGSWLSYSLSNTRYDFPALYPVNFPSNFRIRHAFTSGASFKVREFNIALGYNFRTGLPTTLPVKGNEVINNEINYDAPNSSELPYYSRLDGSLTYDMRISPKTNIRFGAAVWNILDEKNEINRYYRFTDINYPQRASEYSLERTINVLVKVDF